MIFIGDYFALGIIAILSTAYFKGRHYLTKESKIYSFSLVFSALTAILDIISGYCLDIDTIPASVNLIIGAMYYIVNLMTTSSFALFAFYKILQHTYDEKALKINKMVLTLLFSVYCAVVLLNFKTHWLFYIDADGIYQRGPINFTGHILAVIQVIMVLICYFTHLKTTDKNIGKSIMYSSPMIIFWTAIQYLFRDVMLNGFIMAMIALVFYLNFQGQRAGLHSLTNLNDRPRFFKEIEFRLANNQQFQIFIISLKNFGIVNQKYGYKTGDEVLYQVAFGLENLIKKGVAFHLNGTSFSLILPYKDEKCSEKNLANLRDFLDRGIVCMGERIKERYIILEYNVLDNELPTYEIHRRLEYMNLMASNENLNYMKYDDKIGIEMHNRIHIYKRLQKIESDIGFEVWLQPLYSIKENNFKSAEALIRLKEANGMYISPADFIPIAEKSGLIDKVTWFVVKSVCKLLHNEPCLKDLSVSVNLPMSQLIDPDFITKLNGIVDRYGIEHNRIHLEFTERVILESFEPTRERMLEIVKEGYAFYLDDFGTGYSNFNCLLLLPFSCIKLDRSLLVAMDSDNENNSIISTLTDIFHSMNLCVVSEGAETEQQAELLKEVGVDRVQGYYYAKPMPKSEFIEFYKEKNSMKD